MLLLVLPLFLGTFLFAVSILIMFHSEFNRLKAKRKTKGPVLTELPIITPTGQFINTVEELDLHLEFLKSQIEEREKELEASKVQLNATEENLKRLTDTSNEVKKYYVKLNSEITRGENECRELHNQIDDCIDRQTRLKDEVHQNVKFYSNLLGNMENCAEGQDLDKEYEMVINIAPSITAAQKKTALNFYN